MNNAAPPKFGMGARVRRKEDKALITGAGRFTDDYTPAGTLRAVVLRSTMAHANITLDGLEEAGAMPGVRLILTHADLAGIGGLPCKGNITQVDGSHPKFPPHPLLVGDIVRHVGDPIAFIVADDLEQARTAAEAIEIDYEPLDVVIDMEAAVAKDSPLVWPHFGTNVAFDCDRGDKARDRRRLRQGGRVSRIEIVNNRLVANYMETRGIVAEYDAATGRYTLTLGTQGGHGMRDIIAKDILHIPPKNIRVITPDVGGGFGTKAFPYHEYPLAAIAAKTPRPAGQVDRRPHRAFPRRQPRPRQHRRRRDGDGRQRQVPRHARRSPRQHGRLSVAIRAVDSRWRADHVDRPLRHPALYAYCRGIYTNTVPVDAYRGAGRPEAAYLIERLVDQCGRDTGLGPIEIRKRNFIPPAMLPYETQGGRIYDSGEFAGHLDRALEVSDWKGFAARAAAAKRAGKVRGIGFATYVEACAFPGTEPATVTLNEDGTATLSHRHADQRPGPRHRLRAVHRRPSRARLRQDQGHPGRHRQGGRGRGHRRLALDPARRGLGRPRRDQARRPAQGRSPPIGWKPPAGDLEIRRRAHPRRRHQPRHDARRARPSDARQEDADRLRRFLRAARSRPTRTARISPRSRSTRRPASPRSSATGSSTISARP